MTNQEWQPIETAPKHREILAVNTQGVRSVIRWDKHNHIPLYGWIRWERINSEEVSGFDPVKWTPLPDPPKEST